MDHSTRSGLKLKAHFKLTVGNNFKEQVNFYRFRELWFQRALCSAYLAMFEHSQADNYSSIQTCSTK